MTLLEKSDPVGNIVNFYLKLEWRSFSTCVIRVAKLYVQKVVIFFICFVRCDPWKSVIIHPKSLSQCAIQNIDGKMFLKIGNNLFEFSRTICYWKYWCQKKFWKNCHTVNFYDPEYYWYLSKVWFEWGIQFLDLFFGTNWTSLNETSCKNNLIFKRVDL